LVADSVGDGECNAWSLAGAAVGLLLAMAHWPWSAPNSGRRCSGGAWRHSMHGGDGGRAQHEV
jgi:hypothetical protein